jgi:hypothetical protein
MAANRTPGVYTPWSETSNAIADNFDGVKLIGDKKGEV